MLRFSGLFDLVEIHGVGRAVASVGEPHHAALEHRGSDSELVATEHLRLDVECARTHRHGRVVADLACRVGYRHAYASSSLRPSTPTVLPDCSGARPCRNL